MYPSVLRPGWLKLVGILLCLYCSSFWAWSEEFSLEETEESFESQILLQHAWSNNPKIQAYQKQLATYQKVMPYYSNWFRPTLQIGVGVGSVPEDTNSLSVPLEVTGRPQIQKSLAQNRLKILETKLKLAYCDVAKDLFLAKIDLWRDARLQEESFKSIAIVESLEETARLRYEAGDIARNDWSVFLLELRELQAENEIVKAQYQKSLFHWKSLLGTSELELELPRDLDLASQISLEMKEPTQEEIASWISRAHPLVLEDLAKARLLEEKKMAQAGQRGSLEISLYRSTWGSRASEGAILNYSLPLSSVGLKTTTAEKEMESFEIEAQRELRVRELIEFWWYSYHDWKNLGEARDYYRDYESKSSELMDSLEKGYRSGYYSVVDVMQRRKGLQKQSQDSIRVRAQMNQAFIQYWWIQNLGEDHVRL